MHIDRNTIEKLAHLARIEIDPDKEDALIEDMEKILSWIEKLEELDTTGVEPITHMSFEHNVFRPDEANNMLTREQALKNSPEQDKEFFKVPKVLE
ncbi:MAG: Asp-tRNA(Asn)/Glu-tRNA(Gln) amidotransferase subunit GatC [Cyclobacteriaceae bacterium]